MRVVNRNHLRVGLGILILTSQYSIALVVLPTEGISVAVHRDDSQQLTTIDSTRCWVVRMSPRRSGAAGPCRNAPVSGVSSAFILVLLALAGAGKCRLQTVQRNRPKGARALTIAADDAAVVVVERYLACMTELTTNQQQFLKSFPCRCRPK